MFDTVEAREAFSRIYTTNEWDGGSGQGSRPHATEAYRAVLDEAIGAADVGSVVDVGCGDWEFSQLVDWSKISYLGLDVVPEVVAANRARFGGNRTRFEVQDVANDPAPPADLLVCKDVLQHWPNDAIHRFVEENLRRYRYLLLTNDIWSVHCPDGSLNGEIAVGAWRTIDLERPPFRFTAAWKTDLDIGGEWTKRVVLLVRPRRRLLAAIRPGSCRRRLSRFGLRSE